MDDLELYLRNEDVTPTPVSVDNFVAASTFFMELKRPLEKAAEVKGVPAPSQPKTTVAVGKKQPTAVKKLKLPKVDIPKANKVKVAFLSDALRAVAHSARGAGRSASGAAAAYKAGVTDQAPKGIKRLLSHLPSKRVKSWAKDPEHIARGKGEAYYKRWLAGRDMKRLVDPEGLAGSVNKAVRNKRGDMTVGSVLKGLDETGILPTPAVTGGVCSAAKGLQKARADRIAAKQFNRNLAIGGGSAGLGALLLSRKRPERDA